MTFGLSNVSATMERDARQTSVTFMQQHGSDSVLKDQNFTTGSGEDGGGAPADRDGVSTFPSVKPLAGFFSQTFRSFNICERTSATVPTNSRSTDISSLVSGNKNVNFKPKDARF